MCELKRLFAWKEQLEKVELKELVREKGHLKYPPSLTDFMQEVHYFRNHALKWELADPAKILKENGVPDVSKVELSSQKLSVLLALLVEIVQQDRFCQGLLLKMLADKYLLQLLTQIEKYSCSDDDQKYKFCAVSFNDLGQTYSYLCEDEMIQVGDRVIVPVGAKNVELEAIVKKISYATKKEAPYPFDKLKKIIKRSKNKLTLAENERKLSRFPVRKIDELQTLIGNFWLEVDTKNAPFVCPTLKLENIAGKMFHGQFEVALLAETKLLKHQEMKLCLRLRPQVEALVEIIETFGGEGAVWQNLNLFFDDRKYLFDHCYDKAKTNSSLKVWLRGSRPNSYTWKVDYLITRNGVSLLLGIKEG